MDVARQGYRLQESLSSLCRLRHRLRHQHRRSYSSSYRRTTCSRLSVTCKRAVRLSCSVRRLANADDNWLLNEPRGAAHSRPPGQQYVVDDADLLLSAMASIAYRN